MPAKESGLVNNAVRPRQYPTEPKTTKQRSQTHTCIAEQRKSPNGPASSTLSSAMFLLLFLLVLPLFAFQCRFTYHQKFCGAMGPSILARRNGRESTLADHAATPSDPASRHNMHGHTSILGPDSTVDRQLRPRLSLRRNMAPGRSKVRSPDSRCNNLRTRPRQERLKPEPGGE